MKGVDERKPRDTSKPGRRALRQKAGERGAEGAAVDHSARLIEDLEAQKARYERFFASLNEEVIDNQATYAYTSLVKAIADVRKRASEKPDLYAMAPMVMEEFVKFIKAEDREPDKAVQRKVFDLIDRFFEALATKAAVGR